MEKKKVKNNSLKKVAAKKGTKMKSSLNLKEFSKDADLLFKNYNLKTGIIVANILENGEKHLLSCVNSPDKKEEDSLLLATQNLFQVVNLTSESFNVLINILHTFKAKLEEQKTKKTKK